MRNFIIIFIYVIITIGYIDILFEMINARDTDVNYFGLLTIALYLWVSKITYEKFYKIKKDEKNN
jgi:hypothetical protein